MVQSGAPVTRPSPQTQACGVPIQAIARREARDDDAGQPDDDRGEDPENHHRLRERLTGLRRPSPRASWSRRPHGNANRSQHRPDGGRIELRKQNRHHWSTTPATINHSVVVCPACSRAARPLALTSKIALSLALSSGTVNTQCRATARSRRVRAAIRPHITVIVVQPWSLGIGRQGVHPRSAESASPRVPTRTHLEGDRPAARSCGVVVAHRTPSSPSDRAVALNRRRQVEIAVGDVEQHAAAWPQLARVQRHRFARQQMHRDRVRRKRIATIRS